MRRNFLGIVAIAIGLLISGATFAQVLDYPDCKKDKDGDFVCQEYQSCNNADGRCLCSVNSVRIPHNTTCLANNKLIKNRVISSFAVSGSIVTFKFTIENKLLPRTFEVKLPTTYPKIKIIDLSSDGLSNGGSIALDDGFINPRYFINAGVSKTIIITGQIVSSSFTFERITTSACLRNIGISSCLEEPVTFIFPTTNYSIEQKILDPKPIYSGEDIRYEISVVNNGSKSDSSSISLSSILGNFLGLPKLTYQGSIVSNTASQWDLGVFSPGETKTYVMTVPFTSTPVAGSVITTTGHIAASSHEVLLSDNTASSTYTLPTVIDLSLDSVEKTTGDPEASGNILGFSITYKNKGNLKAQNIVLTTVISGTTQSSPTTITLPDIDPETTNTVAVTGIVDQAYPIGTKFCFSGTISAGNETETLSNNTLSGVCYTFVKSADVAVTANLSGQLLGINKGSTITYTITLTNNGGKTANDISLNLHPSTNQTPQTPILLTGITLNGGETKTLSFSSVINDYPFQGTTITLSGDVSFPGIDLDSSNNTFSLSNTLPGLADVYVRHTMVPFSGFKAGDTVTYIISYGNSGFAAAENPTIAFSLPSSIEASQTTWNLGNSLAVGASGTLVVTGTLKQFLAAGTAFSSEARISTPSAQVTTSNDISSITGTVASYDNISFSISAQNESRSAGNVNAQLIRAISGHLIKFTITYVNNGNVPANNVTLSLSNVGTLILDSYNQNIGTIGVNQQGTITITGRIGTRNFVSIFPTATISYNGTGISRTFTIEEPYQCGDGLLTRDEVCEPNGLGVINGDQSCENQQGRCVLVTKRISNVACFQTLNGTEVCSDPAIITLKDPTCKTIDVNKIDSTSVSAICFGENATTYTPMSISCGNGMPVYSGFASAGGMTFSTTCSYASKEAANNAIIRCSVGNDINNTNCQKSSLSCDLDLETEVVILDSDEKEGSVEVECSTNGDDASLQIDCGNGDKSDVEDDDVLRYTCKYDEDEFSSNHDLTKDISCRVNGTRACDEEIILDKGFVGICGNGVREGYEQCDGGGTKGQGTRRGLDCKKGCTLEEPAGACLSLGNGNISVQNNEIMPFWWKIYDTTNITTSSKCNESNHEKIRESSMKCHFSIKQPGEDAEKVIEIPCDQKQLAGNTLFSNFYPQYWSNAFGNYYINFATLASSRKFNENILGEHKIRLDKVEYEYCACDDEDDDCDWEETELNNVCETNFTVTKPYLVQKSAFGITPKATTIDLKYFYDVNKDALVNKTDLSSVMVLDESDYANSSVIQPMIDNFVYRMEKLAVKVSSSNLPKTLKDAGVSAKKVPNKEIYILEGGKPISLKPGANFSKPFTLIVKNTTLIIEGNIDVNGMFIAQNGTIAFNEKSDSTCTIPQTVKGIFVASNFTANKIQNTSLSTKWCDAGGLHVKGVLIGNGIKNLVQNRRASLSKWFYVNGSDNSIKVQRRNQIFNGASVLIEYSPELWQQLPPGADEFTKALEVYKK